MQFICTLAVTECYQQQNTWTESFACRLYYAHEGHMLVPDELGWQNFMVWIKSGIKVYMLYVVKFW